jgi:sugar O-acyltransferase (sialic acid O-acetyltransferase NeuD family)
MVPLLLLGSGGHSRVVAETAMATRRFSRIACLDDRFTRAAQPSEEFPWPVIGPFAAFNDPQIRYQFPAAIVAIGDPVLRLTMLLRLNAAGYELPVLIHPTAWVSSSAQIGAASVVFAQAAIQPQVVIGRGAILNTGCSVDHDSHLADGVHICPGARLAGEVQVGARTWIGIGASVIHRIHIGADVTVGAGAAVVRDLPDGVTAVGVPARTLSTS